MEEAIRGPGGEVVKATFNLPGSELESLKALSRRRHIPVVQALRQAIASELFIQRLVDDGAKLLVQLADGTLQQIVFSQAQSAVSSRGPAHAPVSGGGTE